MGLSTFSDIPTAFPTLNVCCQLDLALNMVPSTPHCPLMFPVPHGDEENLGKHRTARTWNLLQIQLRVQ